MRVAAAAGDGAPCAEPRGPGGALTAPCVSANLRRLCSHPQAPTRALDQQTGARGSPSPNQICPALTVPPCPALLQSQALGSSATSSSSCGRGVFLQEGRGKLLGMAIPPGPACSPMGPLPLQNVVLHQLLEAGVAAHGGCVARGSPAALPHNGIGRGAGREGSHEQEHQHCA